MRVRFGLVVLASVLLGGSALSGQTAPTAQATPPPPAAAKLEFDVASVKPSAPLDMAKLQADMQSGKMPNFGLHIAGLRAEYNYVTMKALIANAFKVKEYQITGPAWLGTDHFDIAARMPDGSSKDDAPAMLRSLLEDRFKLKAHMETQEHPVLALVVGKGGPKLKESPAAPAPLDEDAPLKSGEMKMNGPDGPIRITTHPDGTMTENMGAKGTATIKMDGQTMHIVADTVTMPGFADMLTNVMQMGGTGGRQVVDMTELKGNYQVALEISMADIIAAARAQGVDMPGMSGGGAAPSDASDPGGGGSTVFGSVEKLGLKLEQRKAPVEQVVVDSEDKTPTEN